MNDLHKYATFSVDLLGTPNRINSVFSIGRARVFYKGLNRNHSIIDGEIADQLASTIPGTPIIGTYNYDTGDFEGHEENPNAYGFVPLDPHMRWVKENEREYLEVDVVIWDGRFEEAKEILSAEKHLSMELNGKTIKGTVVQIGESSYYKISYAEFAGIAVLGDDVEPCFEDARFITAYSNMISAYALFIEETQRKNEGGKNIMDDITEIVEPEVATEEVIEEVETEEVVETEDVETESVVEPEVETEGETADDVEETEEVETVELSEDAEDYACGDKDTKCEKDEESEDEVCPECEQDPCICKNALNEEEADDKEDEDIKEEAEEDKCQALESELAEYKAKYELLENKYNEVLSSLNEYSKKEKLEIINKFSTKIESEELIEKLINEVDNYSIEEIKSELGQELIEQLAAEVDATEETNANANFSLNINIADNDLGNSAWDLVKRHKANR